MQMTYKIYLLESVFIKKKTFIKKEQKEMLPEIIITWNVEEENLQEMDGTKMPSITSI